MPDTLLARDEIPFLMAHPARRSSSTRPRAGGLVGRVVGGLVRFAFGLVVLSMLQVLAVRFVNPPFTETMLDRVWTAHGKTGRWTWVDSQNLPLSALGETVARAAVASEDAQFWFHHGFDLEGICLALARDEKAHHTVAGGSTISQQVARNVFLWQGRSWLRKGLETWYTAWMELLVPKRRILELYLNVAETGPMTFGAEAGARRAFGVSAAALTAPEAAALVAILPAPRRWTVQSDEARQRAAWILANPAPFPGDPGYPEAGRAWAARAAIPARCLQ